MEPEPAGNLVVLETPKMIDVALAAYRAGLSVLPPKQDGTKAPDADHWKERISRRPNWEHIANDYRNGTRTGLGIVCGSVSGGIEVLDFDDREKYAAFCECAKSAGLGDLVERIEAGYKENTPNGVHLMYRCSATRGNLKLARRPKTDDEKTHPNDKVKCLIETRGNGGYAILAPSHGSIHPSGKPYTLIRGGFESIVTITPDERAELHRIARTFDEMPPPLASSKPPKSKGNVELRPGDDYNDRAMWTEILEPHGWVSVFERNGERFWRRPGKSVGISATTNFGDSDLFYCFSTSTPFETERGIDKLGAYAALNHDGNIAAAAKALAAQGFGKQQAPAPGPHREKREEQPDWPERLPIPDVHDPVPTLDEALIPGPLRPWVVDIAERLCVPLAFIAAPAVVATSSVVGRVIGILPKRHDDWTVVPNTWGAVVAPTGELKTQAISQAFAPVRRLAIAATDQFRLDESDSEAQQAILEAKVSALKQRAKADSAKNKEVGDIQSQLAELMREQKECAAYERRYTTQDATVEKLGELLIQNPRGMTLLRDELSGWARTLDKPGREGDREFYLEAWNGDGRYSVDRIGRGTIHIPSLTLSIFGGIQPGKLQTYVDDALDHRQGDDGLIQRIQVLVWPDGIQKWENIDRWPKTEAREAAFRIYKGLDDLDPEMLGASPIHDGDIPALRFGEDAQGLFDDWRDDLEQRLRGEDLRRSPSFAGHLAKYRSLMPSLALLFHLVEAVDRGTRGPVSLGNARLAAAWCEFLEAHARKLYGAELRPGVPAARRIADRIKKGDIRDGMTVNEIARCQWSGLGKTQTVNAGLEVLEASGWVKCAYTEPSQTGGRPAHLVRLHPDLLRESRG